MSQELDEIEKLFPITITITEEIINKSDVTNIFNCIGVNTVKSLLEQYKDKINYENIHWGTYNGFVYDENGYHYLMIESDINMSDVIEPTKVTLFVKNKTY